MQQTVPIIIARADHTISRSLISPNALKALYRLRDHGFDARLVGGCVRDLLLGREPKDFDLVTDATPTQIKRLFRNCRLVGRRFRLAHLHYGDEIIEVATFRAAAGGEDEGDDERVAEGRPPRVVINADGVVLRDNLFGSPAEDAWRRDFTINALSYAIADFSVIDYVGGGEDLRRGVIRTIGDPHERFTEDPVRMVRAIRFAAQLGFALEEETQAALHDLAPTIVRAAPARLYEEVLKLFLGGAAEQVCAGLRASGLYEALFPHHHAWLEAADLPAHAWDAQVLRELDRRYRQGEKVPPPLFLALFFGDYLLRVAGAEREGVPAPSALDAALARFMEDTVPRVQIQRRVALQVREILQAQRRFLVMPGKRSHLFVARPLFPLALTFLDLSAQLRSDLADTAAWWHRHAVQLPVSVAPEEEKSVPERRRRRSRRRRRAGRSSAEQ